MGSARISLTVGIWLVALGVSLPALAIDPAVKCEAKKVKEAGKLHFCLIKAEAKAIKKGTDPSADLAKCATRFSIKWQKIEDKGAGACPSNSDLAAIQAKVRLCVDDLEAGLGPCPVDAVEVLGACWYLGNLGESCFTACANVGLAYDSATETIAGTGGSAAQCEEVLNAMGQSFSVFQFPCLTGTGCFDTAHGVPGWCESPPTDEFSTDIGSLRVCACQRPPPPTCGDGVVNQASEECDVSDDSACPGQCLADCTCPPPPPPTCGDGVVNQASEECDAPDSSACPGLCLVDCTCQPLCFDTFPMCNGICPPGEQCVNVDELCLCF